MKSVAILLACLGLAAGSAIPDLTTSSKFPSKRLSARSVPGELGLDTVQQYTGYLTANETGEHFFYWTVESRNDPATDPVILWLQGGPGCSSMTGLLYENGPSFIDNATLTPVHNPYSWNNNATVIYLDQPVDSGFSWGKTNDTDTSAKGAKEVYAFLELFFERFPQYPKTLHVAGESYAGHYIPSVGAEILRHPERSFDLKSVVIGNGLVDVLQQYKEYKPMFCGGGGVPAVVGPDVCAHLDDTLAECDKLIHTCYNDVNSENCAPVGGDACAYLTLPFYNETLNINPYDITKKCEPALDNGCYNASDGMTRWLELPEVLTAIGAEHAWNGCSDTVSELYYSTGDPFRPAQRDVTFMLERGLPVLIYAGAHDIICNWLGQRAWTDALPWYGHFKFRLKKLKPWRVDGKVAGAVKSYRGFTFLRIEDAGHMVPHDQPKPALEMINRWIKGDYELKGKGKRW
ncbi:Carboxypeptidase Y [Yarrowia sp. E02]|nr:Carboxypeptidase Y [Yarrowia sp. E02]